MNFQNPAPTSGPMPQHMPADAVKAEFARRVQAAMVRKGWDQATLARETVKQYEKGAKTKLSRDSISKYCRGLVLPLPHTLNAMAKALGTQPDELLPTRGVPSAGMENPPLDVRDIGDGMVWLKVNQAVDWDTALKIMTLVKGEK